MELPRLGAGTFCEDEFGPAGFATVLGMSIATYFFHRPQGLDRRFSPARALHPDRAVPGHRTEYRFNRWQPEDVESCPGRERAAASRQQPV